MAERTIKYIGDGRWIPGVPRRDLTLEEYERCKDLIEAAKDTLYKVPKAKARNKDGE